MREKAVLLGRSVDGVSDESHDHTTLDQTLSMSKTARGFRLTRHRYKNARTGMSGTSGDAVSVAA